MLSTRKGTWLTSSFQTFTPLSTATEILRGVDLELSQGQVHAIMGPNGSGKSTLAHVLMGHPSYEVTAGEVTFKGTDVLELEPDERSRLGIFLAFQYPSAIPGVTVANFLRMAVNAQRRGPDGEPNPIRIPEFRKLLAENMEQLKIDRSLTSRYLNDGFSGGEKKRMEMLQMAMLQPKLAILDETDSGLDIDALRIVSDGVNRLTGPELGVLVITHYARLLQYITPRPGARPGRGPDRRVRRPGDRRQARGAMATRPTACRRRQSDG